MTAFQATYSDFKLIRTRKVVQIVLEVPVEQSSAVLEILGGMPNPAAEKWVGVAPLQPDAAQPRQETKPRPDGAKRDWRDIPPAQRAGIRIGQTLFAAFLKEERPDDWHEAPDADDCLKLICGVDSKRELATNHKALTMFNLLDSAFQAWEAKERVGA